MAGEHRINKSAGRSTGRQRSRKTECNKPAEAMRYNEELRPSITARITIQDTLDPYDVYFIWDGQEKHVPQNVINLRENLLDFSRLVPKEYEGLFRGYMNEGTQPEPFIDREYCNKSKTERAKAALEIRKAAEDLRGTKSRESIWIKSIAVELIFKGLEFDIHNQGYSEVFDRLKMVDNAQFLKQQCGKLVEHVGPGGLTKPRPDLLFGLPVLKPDEIKRFGTESMLQYFEKNFLKTISNTIITSPIMLRHDLCFPWGAYEAKMELSEAIQKAGEVYIQIAGASSVCAALLQQMSSIPGGGQDVPPVISFTSIAEKWDVFLCYKQPAPAKYFVLRIWQGDMTNIWHALQLLHISEYSKTWAVNIFKPWVANHLKRLHELIVCDATPKRWTRQSTKATSAMRSTPPPPVTPRSQYPWTSPSTENRTAHAGRHRRIYSQSSNPGPSVPNSLLQTPDPRRTKAKTTREGEAPSDSQRLTPSHTRIPAMPSPRTPIPNSPLLTSDPGQRTNAKVTREGEAHSYWFRLTPSRIQRLAMLSPSPSPSPSPSLSPPSSTHNATYGRWDSPIGRLQKQPNETSGDRWGGGNCKGFHCEQAYIGAPTSMSLEEGSDDCSDDEEGSDNEEGSGYGDGSEYEVDTDNEEVIDSEEGSDSEESTDYEEDIIFDYNLWEWD